MNNLIFRKLSYDIIGFFLISSFSITLIVWIVQAINLLDLVVDDGHSLKIYFIYAVLNVPKIFSRILIFMFFISIFYVVNKYDVNNEILVFWSNGIKKIQFINFALKISIIFVILQLFLNLFIVPYSQNLGRMYLKTSNVDFLPTLISEKKFINVFKNLTIFVERYNQNGVIENIYIKEIVSDTASRIITSEKGKIFKFDDNYEFILFNGSILDINKNNTYNVNFKETKYDLSKFVPKTVTYQKLGQRNSIEFLICLYNFYFKNLIKSDHCNIYRENGKLKEINNISKEMFKRISIPLYIIILSLISSSLILKPKSNNKIKYFKSLIFLIGFLIIIFSQISYNFVNLSKFNDLIAFLIPIIFVFFFYIFLLFKFRKGFSRL